MELGTAVFLVGILWLFLNYPGFRVVAIVAVIVCGAFLFYRYQDSNKSASFTASYVPNFYDRYDAPNSSTRLLWEKWCGGHPNDRECI
jgi:hypothetical protein